MDPRHNPNTEHQIGEIYDPNSCGKCGKFICVCGQAYKAWPLEIIETQIQMLQRVRSQKRRENKPVQQHELGVGNLLEV